MRIAVFLNALGIGGTEKGACRWARGLKERGHELRVFALADGPRRSELEAAEIEVRILSLLATEIAAELRAFKPDVIHAHAPGQPHVGDILGEALANGLSVPVLQTNIFGKLQNPAEARWTKFRVFISWTSCVQAALRARIPLDENFFRDKSVAVFPVDPPSIVSAEKIAQFRARLGLDDGSILFGRLARPDAAKWTDLPLEAFRRAMQLAPEARLLLREPPNEVTGRIRSSPEAKRIFILPASADPEELSITTASLDAALHTSIIGESFGYGVAEIMNYAKPVIVNSTPWADEAQLELVRHGIDGYVASTPRTMSNAIASLAQDASLRARFAANAERHIRELADPEKSLDRIEAALHAVVANEPNRHAEEDLARARGAARHLAQEQFGHSLGEQVSLRAQTALVRFYHWRQSLRRAA